MDGSMKPRELFACFHIELWVVAMAAVNLLLLDVVGGIILLCACSLRSPTWYTTYSIFTYLRMSFAAFAGLIFLASLSEEASRFLPLKPTVQLSLSDSVTLVVGLTVMIAFLAWTDIIARRARAFAEEQNCPTCATCPTKR